MNSPQTLTVDVLIVGAGPVGLTLANLLGQYGIQTLIIERNANTVAEPRAVTLDDESLRTMQNAGLGPQVIQDVVLGYGVQYFSWRGKPLASILPTRQEYGYPKRNAFRQPLLEGTLRSGLQRFAQVQTRFLHELLEWDARSDGVHCRVRAPEGELHVQARWMVGCDGGRSRVRERCGISLKGATYAERWLIVDMEQRNTPLRHTRTYCDPVRPAIRLPGPFGTLRYEFMLRPGESDEFALDEARFRGWMADRVPEDRNLPLVRKVVYTFHARVASHWRQGAVFLAGDAAHLTPPFAGQGLNSGVRDAANLAWKLAAVARWGAPEALLDTYEAERRPHATALINMALRIGHFMQPKTALAAALSQGALGLACIVPAVRDYILQLRFKPKPRFNSGFFEASDSAATVSTELLPQPLLDLPDRSTCRLDDLLGHGFAVLGWDSHALRAQAARWVPAGAPCRVIALRRSEEDFINVRPDDQVTCARDGSGVLDAFLDGLNAAAIVVRPDRYWCRVIPQPGSTSTDSPADSWCLGDLRSAPPETAAPPRQPHPTTA